MSTVESVNKKPAEVEDSAAEGEPWVDPVYEQQNPERLPDEPEPTPEEIKAKEAEEAAAAEAKRKEEGKLTKKELKQLIDDLPDDDDDGDPGAAEADDDPDKAGEATKKTGSEEDDTADDADAGKAKKTDDDQPGKGGKTDKAAKAEEEKKAEEARRIKRRQRREKERAERLRELERENAELKAGRQTPAGFETDQAAEAEPEAPPQPKLDDFEDASQWAEAMGKWTQDEIGRKLEANARAEKAKAEAAKRKAAEDKQREIYETFMDRVEEAREKYEDFDEVTDTDELRITPFMAAVIHESEIGPEIAYHLGKNLDEAERISTLSPYAQASAIGRIEAHLQAEQASAAAASGKDDGDDGEDDDDAAGEADGAEEAGKSKPAAQGKTAPRQTATKAPPPVPSLSGRGAGPGRAPEKMGMDEYAEGRRTGKIR